MTTKRPDPILRYCPKCGYRYMANFSKRHGKYYPRYECPKCVYERNRRYYLGQKGKRYREILQP